MDHSIQDKVSVWLSGNYDEATKNAINSLQPDELADSFYRNLEFGTGGLRGIMGVGTNRMNKYTVGMATQGFANYLKKTYGNELMSVVIGHDSRNNSRFFAETTAGVFAANGIQVYLFEALRPTPELSYAIRRLGCKAGVVCTASHNPKEYNGYKAYWNDGGQLVPPHDKNVIREVEAITSVDEVNWTGGEANITLIGQEMDEAYISMVKSLSVYPEVIQSQHDLSIVYTQFMELVSPWFRKYCLVLDLPMYILWKRKQHLMVIFLRWDIPILKKVKPWLWGLLWQNHSMQIFY